MFEGVLDFKNGEVSFNRNEKSSIPATAKLTIQDIQKVDESADKTIFPLEPNSKWKHKGAADTTVILVNKTIIEGHSEVLVPVSCVIHPETDYIFHTQGDVLQKYNLISCDTITNGKSDYVARSQSE